MTTLWKRATPSQYRMLRAIAGAVMNAAHAHQVNVPENFARSVAKRATGTLTAQWQEVLAAAHHRRQNGSRATPATREPRWDHTVGGLSEGGRLRLLRRSPIRHAWRTFTVSMGDIKRNGTPEQFASHVKILRLLDEAQRELERLYS
jgi:hypothetical protein